MKIPYDLVNIYFAHMIYYNIYEPYDIVNPCVFMHLGRAVSTETTLQNESRVCGF